MTLYIPRLVIVFQFYISTILLFLRHFHSFSGDISILHKYDSIMPEYATPQSAGHFNST